MLVGLLAGALLVVSACVPPDGPGDPGVADPSLSASVEPCGGTLTVTIDASPPMVQEGETATFESTVRNESVGPCLGAGAGPTIAGQVELEGGTVGASVTDIAAWLAIGDTAVPTSLGLGVSGTAAPGVCPGGIEWGCTSQVQEAVGNVEYPQGRELVVAPGEREALPFRYFPTLDAADLAALEGTTAQLHVAVHTDTGLLLWSGGVDFGSAPAATDVSLEISSEFTASSSVQIGTIASGEEVYLEELAPFTASADHPDNVKFVGRATATIAGEGVEAEATDTIVVSIMPDPSDRPNLPVVVSPDAVTAEAPGVVRVSARPQAPPQASVIAIPVIDEVDAAAVALNDDGVGGDVTAGDGLYSATVTVNATHTAEFRATTVVDGEETEGTVSLSVLPVGAPLIPTTLPGGLLITDPDSGIEYLADRVIVYFEPYGSYGDVLAAAAAVDGSVIGRIAPDIYQIGVTPFASWAAVEPVAVAISTVPGVIGFDLDAPGTLDRIQPDDTEFADQWHHEIVRNDQAWIFNRGEGRSVTVAVIDTGVDLDHPDLVDKIVPGRNIAAGNDNPDDTGGHGTHVAGIIGASANNAQGVAGANWGARIMPIRLLDGTGLHQGNLAAAIRWAVDNGAEVINMSFGAYEVRHEAVARALQHAWDNNVVAVATAGNDSIDRRRYPAAYQRSERFTSWFGLNERFYTTDVIAVGSTDQADGRSPFSNFGDWVDVAAPGTEILSTLQGGGYGEMSGTSMAAPNVAGLASLLKAQEPGISTSQVRRRLVSTGEDIGDLDIGRRINSYEALFNGSFEATSPFAAFLGIFGLGSVPTWEQSGDARSVKRLGPISPREGDRMAWIGTGPGAAGHTATLTKRITLNPEAFVGDTVRLRFWYNFVSDEYPEFVGSVYNDVFSVEVRTPTGVIPVVMESVNTTHWTPVSGIDFPGGDSTVGQSGWIRASVDIPLADLAGESSIELVVYDVGDAVYDSVALIDDVELG